MKKGAINLFLVFGIVLLLSFSFVSANVFSDIWGKFTGKVIDAPSIGVKSASGYWTAWQNRDKPDGNGDLETISNAIQVYSDMCLHPTGIECQTADGKPASSTGQDISCDSTIGLTCFNLDNPGGCLDYRVRFYCGGKEYTCNDLMDTSYDHFSGCSNLGYGGACFNKFSGEFQGCTDPSGYQCTSSNENANNNIVCLSQNPTLSVDSWAEPDVVGKSYSLYVKVLDKNEIPPSNLVNVSMTVNLPNSVTSTVTMGSVGTASKYAGQGVYGWSFLNNLDCGVYTYNLTVEKSKTNFVKKSGSFTLSSPYCKSSEQINPNLVWIDAITGKELSGSAYYLEPIKALAKGISVKYTDSTGSNVKRMILVHDQPEKGRGIASVKYASYISETSPDVWYWLPSLTVSDIGKTYYFEIDGEPGISPGLAIVDHSTYSCTDTDGGLNYYVKGTVTSDTGGTVNDSCFSSNVLTEYFCGEDNNYTASEVHTCSEGGCVDGACASANKTSCNADGRCVIYSPDSNEVTYNSNNKISASSVSKDSVNFSVGGETKQIEILSSASVGKLTISLLKIELYGDSFKILFVTTGGYSLSCQIPTCEIGSPTDTQSKDSNGCEIYMCSSSTDKTTCSSGCLSDGKCVDVGYRKSGTYCNESGQFTTQYNADKTCDNNFQCGSNLCISGKCVSQGLFDKILSWFKNIFG